MGKPFVIMNYLHNKPTPLTRKMMMSMVMQNGNHVFGFILLQKYGFL